MALRSTKRAQHLVFKATGTGEALGTLLAGTSLGLVVPFLIAAVMKTAQGSTTVAIITTASFNEYLTESVFIVNPGHGIGCICLCLDYITGHPVKKEAVKSDPVA